MSGKIDFTEVMIISQWGIKKINKLQLGIFFLIIIISLSLSGLGFAIWRDEVKENFFVSTGGLDLIFTEAKLSGSKLNDAWADISPDGKHIWVDVRDADKNEVIKLDYTVENRGSIPARFYTQVESSDPGLEIQNNFPNKPLIGAKTGGGQIKMQVGKIEEPISYSFSVALHFEQVN